MLSTRTLCRSLTVLTFAALIALGSPHPVLADLSDELKDNIRAALPFPLVQFGNSFSFSPRSGFDLTTNEEADSTVRRARLDFLLKLGQPEDGMKRLQYLRTIANLKLLLKDPDANETCDTGEKLALQMAKASPPKIRARLLALAGNFHTDQGELNEARAVISEALRLSPDTWEAWDAQAFLLFEQTIRAYEGDLSKDFSDTQRWIDRKPSEQEQKRVIGYLTEGAAAASKAVSLQEKARPKPDGRNPNPYFRRALCRSMADALKVCFDAQKNNKVVSFSEQSARNLLSDSAIQDIKAASACEPANPYAIGTYRFLRAFHFRSQEGLAAEVKIALSELAVLEKKPSPDKETRLRLLTTQSLFSAFSEDWVTAAERARKGLDVSPNRASLTALYFMGLFQQEKFAEAEVVASKQVASNDTTINRLSLAKVQSKQNDLVGMERTLAPVVERDKDAVLPAIFLATVRVKATSPNTPDSEWRELGDFIQKVATDHKGKVTRDQAVDLYLVVATFYALYDQEDDAKEILQRVLTLDEDNETAKAMIALLP